MKQYIYILALFFTSLSFSQVTEIRLTHNTDSQDLSYERVGDSIVIGLQNSPSISFYSPLTNPLTATEIEALLDGEIGTDWRTGVTLNNTTTSTATNEAATAAVANDLQEQINELKGNEQIKAFPTAFGGGSLAVGGRGGIVVLVNTLNYNEPLTFHSGTNGGNDYYTGGIKAAISDKTFGDRYVIFDISGISVGDVPDVYDRTDSNYVSGMYEDGLYVKSHDFGYTVLGQTAPRGGFTVTKSWLNFDRTGSIILRHFKVKPNLLRLSGDDYGDSQLDTGIMILAENSIVDNCSSAMSGDKGIIISGKQDGRMLNLTVQNCLAADNATTFFSATNTDLNARNDGDDVGWYYNMGLSSHRQVNVGGHNNNFEVQNNLFQVNSDEATRFGKTYYSDHKLNVLGNVYEVVKKGDIVLQNKYNETDTDSGNPKIYSQGNFYRNDERVVLEGYSGESNSLIWGDQANSNPLSNGVLVNKGFYGEVVNPAPLLSVSETYNKVVSQVGANRYITDSGKLGYYQDDYDKEAIEKFKRREGFLKRLSQWVLPIIPSISRPNNYYGDIKGIPLWFVEKFEITSIHQIINEYVFDDFTYDNLEGYPAIEVFANYISGDIQPYNIYKNEKTKDIKSNKYLATSLDSNFKLNYSNSLLEPTVSFSDEIKEGVKLEFQQRGTNAIQFSEKDIVRDSHVKTKGVGSKVEALKTANGWEFTGDLVASTVYEHVYLEENSLSVVNAPNSVGINTSNAIESVELTDTNGLPSAFRITTANGISGNLNESFPVEPDTKYRYTFDVKSDVNSTARTNNIVGIVEDIDDTYSATGWSTQTGIMTSTSSATSIQFRVYIQPSAGDGSILINNFRVEKIYENN